MNDAFPFPVLHRSRDVAVIAKPAGLAVHPGPRTPHSLEDVLPLLSSRHYRAVAAHRLDRDTSGCLAVALSPRGAKALARIFGEGLAQKTYWAVLDALPTAGEGTIAAPLAKISSKAAGWRMVVDPAGKPAITHWRVLDADARLVEFRPETGRTHQIRVHAAHMGCPISGDPVYGKGIGPMRLHARALVLPIDPAAPIAVEAALPADWPGFSAPESQ